jgi:hypothetical protein
MHHCSAMFYQLIFMVRGGTIWRKLYYAKEGVPMGGKVPKWQKMHRQ